MNTSIENNEDYFILKSPKTDLEAFKKYVLVECAEYVRKKMAMMKEEYDYKLRELSDEISILRDENERLNYLIAEQSPNIFYVNK